MPSQDSPALHVGSGLIILSGTDNKSIAGDLAYESLFVPSV